MFIIRGLMLANCNFLHVLIHFSLLFQGGILRDEKHLHHAGDAVLLGERRE